MTGRSRQTNRFRVGYMPVLARLRQRSVPLPATGEFRAVTDQHADHYKAPGHRHLGPPPSDPKPGAQTLQGDRRSNRPWIRTSHSDSQKRRPRR